MRSMFKCPRRAEGKVIVKTIFDYMLEHTGGSSIDFNTMIADINRLEAENSRFKEALELVAAPKRPDGTYNRSREACEVLARAALENK